MSLYLEQLDHQKKAIEAVLRAMKGCTDADEYSPLQDEGDTYANRPIRLKQESLTAAKLSGSLGGNGIDIKMETGTGKTYVYTRLMYELHKQFGLNKFIVFVPSIPIKEGARSFITADYTNQHFSPLYENVKIDLNSIEAGSFSIKKGRKTMSTELLDYLEGTRNEKNTIKCLLMNDAMLTSKSMTRDDYDQTLIGSTSCPVEGIKLTRPVVIIDEPHRFKKENKAYQAIQALDPQLVIRLGATFPEITTGSGRNKATKKDYENLVYNLGSVESLNDGLVKAVDIHYPSIEDEELKETAQYRVVEINKASDKKYVKFKRIGSDKTHEVRINENLSVVDDGFEGDIEIAEIKNADLAILSNDLEIHKGSILIPQIFSASYQELLVRQAIDKHFVKERENWFREGNNPARVKTLSLFFIDSISSYRDADGWLKTIFEQALGEKLKSMIKHESDPEYKEFLEQSLYNIGDTHGGYFAEDKQGSADEKVQAEVDDILRNKEKMTQFKADGKWNVRRFLFSKWTLREGWDNPNVFVITKLRTSGSEISKLQEVGRGLRLPVDEFGKRLSGFNFRLDYIIDWSERDFAKKLVGEINGDSGILERMTNDMLAALVDSGYAETIVKAKGRLLFDDIIDENDKILDDAALLELLPAGYLPVLQKDKVTVNGSGKRPRVTLRKDNWEKIKGLWNDVAKRYMLEFEKIAESDLKNIVVSSLGSDNFITPQMIMHSNRVETEDGIALVKERDTPMDTTAGLLPYGEFVKRLTKRTSAPTALWHTTMIELFSEGIDKNLINVQSLEKIVAAFQDGFESLYAERYTYSSLDYKASTSVIKDGELVDDLERGLVGANEANDVDIADNYLYDEALYDSEIEHEVLKINPGEKVLVFGKLPRRSIKVPTYTGGTTSPDFIYALDKGHGEVELNLLVETKAKDLRMGEERAIKAQEKLFSNIDGVVWRKVTKANEISETIRKL